ncbi:MAG: DinB family protein [Prevotellaceae bacterium]|jgi:hypothetical protein|nr:DinB family protein [Prevotellaceae bacterium]
MTKEYSTITTEILNLVNLWGQRLLGLSTEALSSKRNEQNRTIKELVGHMVDSASNNQQRMVRLQYSKDLVFPDYAQDNDKWISIQNYQDANWMSIVQLWRYYNMHIVQIIENVDKTKLENSWIDFEGNLVTLDEMIVGYLKHLKLHIEEIKELLVGNKVN